jgi:1-aminocyclopropane-1-carboxylate deaminase/D-cysteine desulfhydrase-like pyridoxal-dependent ACC family enzyme
MKAVLLLSGGEDEQAQGNLLLDRLLGADIRFVEHIDAPYSVEGIRKFKQMHAATVQQLRTQGHRPMVIDKIHRPSVWSIVGGITCGLELSAQLSHANLSADYLFVAMGSGATYAGLFLGMKACTPATQLVGVTCSEKREGRHSRIAGRARHAVKLLGLEMEVSPDEIVFHEDYAGAGHGMLTTEAIDAIKLVARTEGIFLDPVFTGKAMAGLIDQVRHGRIGRDKTVVFLHTGGAPSLFAYSRELAAS